MITLDTITRRLLLQKGLSIHFYLQFLLYAIDCLRELTFDDLHIINYAWATPNEFNELERPEDCLDVISVGFPAGQQIRPLVKDDRLNSLADTDATGTQLRYLDDASANSAVVPYSTAGTGWAFSSLDDNGAFVGRWFGYRPDYHDTYKDIPERCVIQVNEHLVFSRAVIQYLSNGLCANSASQVTPYAIATIHAYMEWKSREHNRTYSEGERERLYQHYLKERRVLRGRMSDVTLDGIRRALQSIVK